MGKDSLIKSTAKKKVAAKKKEEAKKTVTAKKAVPKKKPKAKAKAPQKAAKSVKKVAAKKKAPKKTTKTAAPKAKAAVKVTAKKKATAQKAAPPKKKLSIKELLMKKFDGQRPPQAAQPGPGTQAAGDYTAPPFFTGLSEAETERLKALLLQKFDLPPAPAEPVAKPVEAAAPVEVPPEPAPSEAVAEKPQAPPEPAAPETPSEPEPVDEMPPPIAEEPADPAEKILKYMAGAFALLIVLVIGASFVNQGRFYVNAADGAVEIWQGQFAPKGQKLLVALPGAELPEMAETVLAKQDVYPLAFNYYLDRADAILDVPGAPNFEEVKAYLETALTYAFNQELRNIAYARVNNIDLLILMYKADVAASRGTSDSLEAALTYLSEAKNLASDLQVQQIDQKIEAFGATLASLHAARAEAEQLEADRQQLEQAEAVHQE